jgi:hypothetical protein
MLYRVVLMKQVSGFEAREKSLTINIFNPATAIKTA